MAHVVVTLDVTVDGVSLFGLHPLVRRIEGAEFSRATYAKSDDADASIFTLLPTGVPASATFVLVRAGAPVTLQFNGQSDAGIALDGDGLVLVLDGVVTATRINNNDGTGATAPIDA